MQVFLTAQFGAGNAIMWCAKQRCEGLALFPPAEVTIFILNNLVSAMISNVLHRNGCLSTMLV